MRIMLRFLLVLAVGVVCAVPATATEYRKTKVAVLDFQQQGQFETVGIGRIAAEWLTTSLVETGRFEIIERRLLQQILDEQKMGISGLIDPDSATRLGKILGVRTVVAGTIQHYENTYELNVRLINVETGAIITADRIMAGSASSLRELVNRLSARLVKHFPLQGYVVQRRENKVMIDLGRQLGVVPGLRFTVFVEGQQLRHPKTGEILAIERLEKGAIIITEVRDKTALGTIESEMCSGCIQEGQQVNSVQIEESQRREEQLQQQEDERKRVARDQEEQEKRLEAQRKADEERFKREQDTAEKRRKQEEEGHILGGLSSYAMFSSTKASLTSLSIAPAGIWAATGDDDGRIQIWDLANKKQTAAFYAHRGTVAAVDISADGKLLASAGQDKRVVIWNIAKQEEIASTVIPDKPTDIEFSTDGHYLAIGSENRNAWIWRIATNSLRPLKNEGDVLAVAFNPDGKLLATAGKDKTIQIWSTASGKLVKRLGGFENDVRMLRFLSGGKRLVSVGDDKRGYLWDVTRGTQLRQFGGHEDQVVYLAASRDGRKLVTAERRRGDGLIIFWDTETGHEIKRYRAEKRVDLLGMTPDGTLLVVGSDKNLTVYRLD